MEPQKQATCESAIQLGDLTINAKGGKYVPLRRNGGPPVWQSAEWQKIIWHPAAFNDPSAKRVGLCLEPDEASRAQLQEIEQHLVRALTALSLSEPKVFGKFLTETDVKDRFQSCLKTSPRGGSYLAEDGLGASPHLGAQSGGAGGARQPRRQGVQGPVRAAPNMADVQPVRPTARSDRSAAEGLRGRRSRVPLLGHAQELAAGGPASAHIEMLESEVRALGVAQEDPPRERQALARGVDDGVAQPGVLQEGGVGEGVAAVQDDLLGAHFGHVHVDALADPAAGPDELEAGPDPHGLRHVGGRRASAGVLDRDSFRRGQAAVVPGVDPDGVEMTRLTSGSPCRGNRSRAAWSASVRARGCSGVRRPGARSGSRRCPGRSSCSR